MQKQQQQQTLQPNRNWKGATHSSDTFLTVKDGRYRPFAGVHHVLPSSPSSSHISYLPIRPYGTGKFMSAVILYLVVKSPDL